QAPVRRDRGLLLAAQLLVASEAEYELLVQEVLWPEALEGRAERRARLGEVPLGLPRVRDTGATEGPQRAFGALRERDLEGAAGSRILAVEVAKIAELVRGLPGGHIRRILGQHRFQLANRPGPGVTRPLGLARLGVRHCFGVRRKATRLHGAVPEPATEEDQPACRRAGRGDDQRAPVSGDIDVQRDTVLAQSEGASTAPSETSPGKGVRRRSRRSKRRAVAADSHHSSTGFYRSRSPRRYCRPQRPQRSQ